MKKSLLSLCLLGASAMVCSAAEPFYVANSYITGISPNKNILVSEMFGSVVIYDLESGEQLSYDATEDGTKYYSCGVGNYMANNAICISQGETFGSSAFIYGKTGVANGMFVTISKDVVAGMGAAHGVTADGTRYCGNNPTGVEFGIDAEDTMIFPCIWDRNGNTFTRTVLPCPTVDYAGLAPQYVTALSISDDGKTVLGQLVSNNGFLVEFVVYTQAEDGTWSYTKPLDHLVNPNKRELPEYPGDGPRQVLPNEYMSEDVYNQYLEDLTEYYNDPEGKTAPVVTDYMTPEELAAYTADLQPYLEWLAKYEAWETVDTQIREESIAFVFNLNSLSPNGRYFGSATASTKFVNLTRITSYHPFVYDLVENRIVVNGGDIDVRVTGVSDNGEAIGFVRDTYTGEDYGYFLPAGATEWIPLEQYVVDRKPSLAQWVEENWKHEVEVVIDPEEYITEFQTKYITGLPFISRDFSMISTVFYPTWEVTNPDIMDEWYNSCIIDLSDESGIEEIESSDNQNAPVEYFNLHGMRISEPENGIFIRRQGNNVSKICK